MKNNQKGFIVPLVIVIIAILAIGGGVYIYTKDQKQVEIETVSTTTNTQVQATTPKTDISRDTIQDLKSGDKVGNMTVVSVGRLNLSRTDVPLSLNARIVFSGQATLTGTYTYYGDDEGFLFGEVCFTPDEKSKNNLPQFSDSNRTFFCFSNKTKAQQDFGPKGSTGKATVTVDKYNLVYLESEVWNTAELVNSSIAKSTTSYVPTESKGDMPSTKPQKNVFSVSVVSGTSAPLTVQFTNGFQTAGDMSIDYGDGTSCSTANPDGSQNCNLYTHTYTKAGTYIAILYRHLPTTELGRTTVVVTQAVVAPSITVLTPNGGETLGQNTTHSFTWSYTGLNDNDSITIGFRTSNENVCWAGKTTASSRSYSFAPSQVKCSGSVTSLINGGQFKAQLIVDKYANGLGVADMSNNYFTIIK